MSALIFWLGGIVGPKTVKSLLFGLGILALFGIYLIGDHNGAVRVKNRVAAERAEANLNAVITDSAAKEQASLERASDTATIADKEKDQVNAIHGETDADIRRSAACQRLRASRGDQAAHAAGC